MDQNFPELAGKYREVYRGQGNAPRAYDAALSRRFRKIALKHGIPIEDRGMRERRSVSSASLRYAAMVTGK